MAQPESERPENEESDPSNLDSSTVSNEGNGVDDDGSFQGEVDDMLSSIEVGDSDTEEVEISNESEGEGPVQKDDSNSPVNSSPDDLLMKAGSILNGRDTEIPDLEPAVELEPDSSDSDLDGLMSMPDPQSLMNEPEEGVDSKSEVDISEEGELIAMPNPQALMDEAGAVVEKSDSQRPSNIAEQGGELPPPPPAPVALEEDEIEREFSTGEAEDLEKPDLPNDQEVSVSEELPSNDPGELPEGDSLSAAGDEDLAGQGNEDLEGSVDEKSEDGDDLLLDDEDSFLMDDEDESDLPLSIQKDTDTDLNPETDSSTGNLSATSTGCTGSRSDKTQGSPKYRILNTATRSLPFAAALAVLGLGLIVSSFKNELFEWVSHGDAEDSSISRSIAKATTELFNDLGPDSPYRMVWLESRIKRVSDTELLIEAQVGAELEVDLYQAVDESIIYSKLPFDLEQLDIVTQNLETIGRKDLNFPTKGWKRLYEHSASKGEVFPFYISYRLLKAGVDSEWELSGIRMKEGDHGFAWSRGRPKEYFGARAVDVDSNEFAVGFRAFEKAGMAYLKNAAIAEEVHLATVGEAAKQAQKERQDLIMALSQGSYFKGMVIAGEEGSDAREVSLIITETRNDGGMIKGVLKLEKDESSMKHFTGFFDVVESDQGIEGQLELTTVAFSGQTALAETPTFFNPGTVSRIKLQTDGYRMEGDADEISLRLIRSL